MSSRWQRIVTAGLGASLLLPTIAAAQTGAFPAGETRRQGIDHHTRLLLVRAQVEGKTQGIVLLATTQGTTGAVADSVRRWGGVVQARFDEVGYLRVRLPLAVFARVQALPSVIEAYLDAGCQGDRGGCAPGEDIASRRSYEDWYIQRRVRRKAAEASLPAIPRAAERAISPYTPVADMGLTRLREAHSTYDGRGVTIGTVEWGVVDVTHPALQTARSLSGVSLPKVRGVLTPEANEMLAAPDPTLLYEREPNERQAVLHDTATVEAVMGVVTIAGEPYQVGPGRYAVGRFSLIRDFYTEGTSWPAYAVVWDPARRLVWVDTDRDRDFRDEAPLHDINTRFSAGRLWRDSTAADPAPAIGFAVSFDSVGNRLRILPGQYVHHTMVASVAAAAHLLGGSAGGAAPGAQLVSVNTGASSGEMIEAFVRALRDPRIDLLSCSSGAGDGFLGTGDDILSIVVRRAIALYRKPVFQAGGNGGRIIQGLDESGSTEGVLTVGASATRATLQAHFGWRIPAEEQAEAWSNRGPTRDGALKPDLLAPPYTLVAQPCGAYVLRDGLTYRVPCYGVGGGTSAAAPAAAGAAAVLLSAAKQAGVPHDVARVNWALIMGARTLPGAQVHEQGNGVIDVARAWALLKMQVDLPTIVTTAPVVTTLNRYLRAPGVGRGLLEREGWRAGERGTRTITLTRTAGGGETYRLRWHGTDGTFGTPWQEITLPLGRPVAVPVTIAPATAGVHSAALELVDPVHDVPVHRVAATVVAAEPFTAANQYTVRRTLQVPWPASRSVFVEVPAGTAVLRVDLRVRRGKVRLSMDDGSRGGMGRLNEPTWMAEGKTAGERMTRLVQHPTPGVWELSVGPSLFPNHDDGPQHRVAAEAELVVTLLGAEATSPAPTSATAAVATVGFTNRLGPVGAGQIVTTLGARRVITDRADSARGPVLYTVAVDSGTTTLRVAVTPTDTTANLELHLYDCTSGRCTLWDVNRRLSATKSLLVPAPPPGTWKVGIDPARVPPGGTAFTYTEIQTGPSYGSVTAAPVSSDGMPGVRTAARTWATRVAASPTPGLALGGREFVVVADLIDAGAERDARAYPFGTAPGEESLSHSAIVATTVVALP